MLISDNSRVRKNYFLIKSFTSHWTNLVSGMTSVSVYHDRTTTSQWSEQAYWCSVLLNQACCNDKFVCFKKIKFLKIRVSFAVQYDCNLYGIFISLFLLSSCYYTYSVIRRYFFHFKTIKKNLPIRLTRRI